MQAGTKSALPAATARVIGIDIIVGGHRLLQMAVMRAAAVQKHVLYNERHVLKQLLPDVTNHQYHLRQRRHNHCLTVKTDDRNFVTRQLFKDLY